jgi:hypothetical protein
MGLGVGGMGEMGMEWRGRKGKGSWGRLNCFNLMLKISMLISTILKT